MSKYPPIRYLAIALLLVQGSLLSMPSFGFSYTLKLSQAQLQEQVEAMLPIEKKQYLVTVRLSEPELELLADSDQIGIGLNVEAVVPGGLKGSGRGKLLGSVSYDREQGAFFLKDPELRNLQIDRVPARFNTEIARIAQMALGKTLNRFPVYRLSEANGKHKLAKSMLESVQIKDQLLHIKLKPF